MPEDLVQFWSRCHFDAPPFVHPDDRSVLEENGWQAAAEPAGFEEFVSGPRFGNLKDKLFHLSLFPVPYAGDVRHAPIIILLLNPGFGYSDYWAEFTVPEFLRSLRNNLHQSFDHTEFPFLFLDPKFCWHGGFIWWEEKLRDVIRQIADVRFSGQYLPALRFMAQNLACVELLPYHSISGPRDRLIQSLPSAVQAKSFFHDHLMHPAIQGERTVIVTRKKSEWGVQTSVGDLVVYEGGLTRGAPLSTKSPGGKAILKRFGILAGTGSHQQAVTNEKAKTIQAIPTAQMMQRRVPPRDRLYKLVQKPLTPPRGRQRQIVLGILAKAEKPMSVKQVAELATRQGLRTVGGVEDSCSYHLHQMVLLGLAKEVWPGQL